MVVSEWLLFPTDAPNKNQMLLPVIQCKYIIRLIACHQNQGKLNITKIYSVEERMKGSSLSTLTDTGMMCGWYPACILL